MTKRNYIVVGAGSSGSAVCKLICALGHNVLLLEKNPNNINAAIKELETSGKIEIKCGEHHTSDFENCDLIILSPGVPLNAIKSFTVDKEILSETEFAWEILKEKLQEGDKILAVTGTSGKTTTVSLCEAMLKAHGYEVFLGGNIGTPLSEYVLERMNNRKKADVIVLELSSFQLQTCKKFCPHVSMILNVSENHLDHHKDMQEYIDAKFNIGLNQDENDYFLITQELCELAKNYDIKAKKEIIELNNEFTEMNLFGKHNKFNISCAYSACEKFGVSLSEAQKAVKEFKSPPHRLEHVKTVNEVVYVNDSKGTTVASLKVALEAFENPVLLLMGGKFKGGDLESLHGLIKNKVKALALYGASREIFEEAFKGLTEIYYDEKLEDAVKRLKILAKSRDIILLSPATASFDQYKNYLERGEDFKRVVMELV